MKVSHVAIIGGGLAVTGVIIWLLLQEKKCAAYTTEAECSAAGCYWWDNACHSAPKPKPPEELAAEIMSIGAL